jgi:hypothetical protein
MTMATCALCVVQVARGVSIFLFYPLLSTGRIGYPMTWKTALFMVWAGLRGAVSDKDQHHLPGKLQACWQFILILGCAVSLVLRHVPDKPDLTNTLPCACPAGWCGYVPVHPT